MNVAWGLCWEEAGIRNLVFFRVKCGCRRRWKVPCVCGAGAAAIVSMRNRFSLGVLPRVVVDVCYRVFWNLFCRSECNGCMIVVTFCCHVCRDMRVRHVMLQNAL